MDKPGYDAFDIESQEATRTSAKDKAKIKQRIEVDDVRHVMGNKRGRRFVYGLLERAGVWRSSFNTNALTMAFNEGTRNEGLALVAKLGEHCGDSYSLMLKEHKDDE